MEIRRSTVPLSTSQQKYETFWHGILKVFWTTWTHVDALDKFIKGSGPAQSHNLPYGYAHDSQIGQQIYNFVDAVAVLFRRTPTV